VARLPTTGELTAEQHSRFSLRAIGLSLTREGERKVQPRPDPFGTHSLQNSGHVGQGGARDVADVEFAGKSTVRPGRFEDHLSSSRLVRLSPTGGIEVVADCFPGDGSRFSREAGERRERECQIGPDEIKTNTGDGGGSTPASNTDGLASFTACVVSRQEKKRALIGYRNTGQGAVVSAAREDIVFGKS
jgi:hypothetical protein